MVVCKTFTGPTEVWLFPNLYPWKFVRSTALRPAKKDLVNLEDEIGSGNFSPLLQWLTNNIYSQGMRYYAHDLVKKITGKALSSKYLLSNLTNKYVNLYNL